MMSTAEKIISIRKRKGLSQEELAESAGVNLRTIQRIEKGENIPRGHTLNAIASSLDEPVENLLESGKKEDKHFLRMLNLSALTFILFPLLNVVLPTILWVNKKDEVQHAAEVGRSVISFQIMWTIASFVAFLLVLLTQLISKYHYGTEPGLGIFYVLAITYIINISMILYAAVQLKKGNYDTMFPFRFRII